jgi:hypothetical protein
MSYGQWLTTITTSSDTASIFLDNRDAALAYTQHTPPPTEVTLTTSILSEFIV